MSTTAHKKSRCVRLCAVVEGHFPGTHKINHVAHNNVKSMFLAVVDAKAQRHKGDILCKLCTYLIYRLNSTFFLKCKRYFQLETAAIFSHVMSLAFFYSIYPMSRADPTSLHFLFLCKLCLRTYRIN